MSNETIESRLNVIRDQFTSAQAALEKCEQDFSIHTRIENANAREIEKLKRHVAKLQVDSRERGTQ